MAFNWKMAVLTLQAATLVVKLIEMSLSNDGTEATNTVLDYMFDRMHH